MSCSPINDVRRALIFRVVDGQSDLFGLMSIMNENPKCDEMLRWLIAHRYTGKTLLEWFKHSFAPNPYKMFQHILANPKPSLILYRDGSRK